MKTRTIVLWISVAAAAIILGQWAVVIGSDDFTLHSPTNHKVFTYGFPFPIVDGAQELPTRTQSWQIPFRLIGNFAFFFGVGLLIVKTIRVCNDKPLQNETANPLRTS